MLVSVYYTHHFIHRTHTSHHFFPGSADIVPIILISHLSHVGIAFLGNKKANKMLRFISKFYNYYL